MKNIILKLLKECDNDSKSKSYQAEKELCKILNGVIEKLEKIQDIVGYYVWNFENIDSIDTEYYGSWLDKLPELIRCNDDSFIFRAEWLDCDLKEYFNMLLEKRKSGLATTISNVENGLNKHKEELKRIENLKFEDIKL